MGAVGSMFGGKPKKKAAPAPVQEIVKNTQEAPGATDTSASKRRQSNQRSSLVSGRSGAPTRSGINVPGRG
jgi:hypothetical protein